MTKLRRLQTALGLLWIVDGLLQLQSANLSAAFAQRVTGTAMAQPGWVQALVVRTAHVFGAHPLAAGLGLGLVQITLGTAIIVPSTRRRAMICSVPFALGVWALGEGFGGLLTGFSMLPSGAPGAALLYAVAAVVLLAPTTSSHDLPTTPSPAQYGWLGDHGASIAWGVLWGGAALQQVIPFVTLGFKLSANLQMSALGEPGWLAASDGVLARFAATHELVLTSALVVFELLVASIALAHGPRRLRLLQLALVGMATLWVFGENFAQLLTGSATDVGAMPLYALLALALVPSARTRPTTPSLQRGQPMTLAPLSFSYTGPGPVETSVPPECGRERASTLTRSGYRS